MRRGKLIKLSVMLASVLFALLIAEIGLRIVGYTYPLFYTTDAERGYALRPNMAGWYRKEGAAYVEINSRGLRDREHELSKPENTFRIAIVGDSYAEALQVAAEEAFWAVMRRGLNECAAFDGKKVEVINFGVSGYGTAQELLTVREHVLGYAPDIVLLAFTTNNDITDNSRLLKRANEIPYFVVRDNQIVLDDSFKSAAAFRLRGSFLNRTGRFIRDASRVVQMLHQSHAALKSLIASRRASVAANGERARAAVDKQELGIDNLIYREPLDPTWTDAWQITEKLIAAMRDDVRAAGAEFLVVTLSNGIQVHPDAKVRADFLLRTGSTDLFYPERRLKTFGERESISVINLAPALQSYAEQHRAYLHGFDANLGNGHWNALGHRVAGEQLAERMCGKR